MKTPSQTSASPAPAQVGGQEVLSASLRRYLYFSAALTGAAILIVEILGAKMLSPYFGTSHFVWTAQIAVTLVSLACGYYLGGRMADRSPQLGRMYTCILIAAVYLCISIPLCGPISLACLKLRLALGSLLAAIFLFFVPLTLLATVGPFLVRNFTENVNSVGSQMGRLSALSTLGSVAGTLLVGYVLVPHLPNSITMFLTAVVLLAVVIGYFFLAQKKSLSQKRTTLLVISMFAGLAGGYLGIQQDLKFRIPEFEELERRNSNFGQMMVIQHTNGLLRYYLNDLLTQNTFDPLQKKSVSMFTYMLHGLSRAYTPKIDSALCIGLGVGIVPMELAKEGAKVDVVEINPEIPGVAERFFNFDPKRVNLMIDDGRHYLNECEKQYDTIILDAFLGDSSPSHLMTKEAFAAMKKILRPNGTLIINSFGDLDPGRNFFTASLERTLQSVFKSVRIHTAFRGNILFAAADVADLKFAHEPDSSNVHPYARRDTEMAYANLVSTPPRDGRVLTDDFNPVEYHDAKNREEIRKNLVRFLRSADRFDEDYF